MKSKLSILIVIVFLVLSCKKQNEEKVTATAENHSLTNVEQLLEGNQRFIDEKPIHPHQNRDAVKANENGQKPFAVVVTCSDSRVSPEIAFDQGVGDLFVIRNAGNLITNIDMGSIEYAVEHLDSKLIVVLGHTECGAIKAYIEDKNGSYKNHFNHIDDIVETISMENEEIEAAKKIPKEKNYLGAIDANIKHSIKLIEDNPIVKEHKVKVVAMRYDVHTGKVIVL
ncbi:carbonic anhydrase [Flavobacterium daemonense]|uniref:carbonic anhydrase n=1 Tax=Flavobacterium daemonense TaxID=1393049 RepID=UPI0011867D83|nr:carbonic anhydrase [Flavobacterium daemonense]KAF2333821.1 carbonic anhydrase [Flavobacterium daemonense]